MQVKVRPYIWESANRPMFVRSVWLDTEGHRHVLLDEEKRKRKENRSMRRTHTERVGSIEDLQNFGFENFGINGRELQTTKDIDRSENKSLSKKLDRSMGKLRACRKMCEKSDISFVSLKHQLNRASKAKKMKTIDTKNEENGEDKITIDKLSPSKEDESHKNQLTERVLNWLDKTGKFTSFNPTVKKEKITLPEIHVKENDTEEDWNTENFDFAKKVMSAENILRPRVKTASIPLKRSESVHTLSLTFDDDDGDLAPNPYGLSRCRSAALRFGDFFPATYKCSKKFLSLCSRKTSSASSLSAHNNRVSPPLLPTSASTSNLTNLNELPETTTMTTTSNGMTANSIVISLNNLDLNKLEEENCGNTSGNRNSQNNNSSGGMEISNNNTGSSRRRKILRRKDTLIENQYRHIIHKHILETQCNTQIVKRQLHIFIPKLPKKDKEVRVEELKPPTQDNECDSCLSTVFSEAN